VRLRKCRAYLAAAYTFQACCGWQRSGRWPLSNPAPFACAALASAAVGYTRSGFKHIGPGLTGQGMSLALLRYAVAFIHPEQFDYDRRHLRGAVHNPKRGAAGDAEELVGIVRGVAKLLELGDEKLRVHSGFILRPRPQSNLAVARQ
jgi:hypothetical protein